MKVSYCCTLNVASIIKSHNKKLINTSINNTLPCNCRKKYECLLDGKCRAENIVYKYIASVHAYPNKAYVGTAGDFKQRFYNHRMSFNSKGYSIDTTLSKYVWEVKRKLKTMPSLKWYIIKSVPAYSNISKKCQLCLQEKFEILNYLNPNELLNKRYLKVYFFKFIFQSLFQSAATLISFYCLIVSLAIRPPGKCPIRNT